MGRKKIELKKQEDLSKRHITFSKRRTGLFGKAAEMCMLTDAQIAILVSSPSNKPNLFSFGHPSANTVIDAFLAKSSPPTDHTTASLCALHREVKAIELEKKTRQNEERMKKSNEEWWRSEDYKELESLEQLQAYAAALEKLTNNVAARMESKSMEAKKNH